MRIAILSDLHANLEATEAVLADAREHGCTEFVCLGDVVGYNANPRECVEMVRNLNCPVVKGNHDEQAALGESSRDFNALAQAAIDWTREQLNYQDKQWLHGLPLSEQVWDFTIVHASLCSPERWDYVFNSLDAAGSLACQETPVCFFGHTHVAGAFVRDDGIKRVKADQLPIDLTKKYFINVGSVGQSRDGDWRAAYCIYHIDDPGNSGSTGQHMLEQRRVKYDIATAQMKIIHAGLPRLLADRLELGR
jgi:predicted phosphodiesterase